MPPSDGRTVVDERIITDPERFWDHYQSKILPRIYDYVMTIGEGKPEPADAPYFGELIVDLTLSEPDYQIGIDKEQIASMEALHEEIYFNTLHFFDVLGRNSRGEGLDYPGRVIPIVRPKADGQAGRAKITFTGFKSIRPAVVVTYREAGGRPGRSGAMSGGWRSSVRPQWRRWCALGRTASSASTSREGGHARTIRATSSSSARGPNASTSRSSRPSRCRAMFANLEQLRAAGLYATSWRFTISATSA